MWFKELTGFSEESPRQVRDNITVEGTVMTSLANGSVFNCGQLETPSLAALRERVRSGGGKTGRMSVREVVADVQDLHADDANAGAMFQVASQFNLLEMVSPEVTPDRGVGIYENDPTQGPVCAVSAGAGTIYRNYFANINGEIGQSATHQIDCLAGIASALGNTNDKLWEMKNGYALASKRGLVEISSLLRSMTASERDQLRDRLRVGIQWNTQVTLHACRHLVSQIYCSALPVAYSPHSESLWADFATLVLEAAYEATFCAAIANSRVNGNDRLFLTFLGAGAFGNKDDWIVQAIDRSVELYRESALDVVIVSYGRSRPEIRGLLT